MCKSWFCKHKEKVTLTNIYGDMINQVNCRCIKRCTKCGKRFFVNELDGKCKIVNFREV